MGPRGPQTASKAVNMHETIVRACLVDHMHVMGPGGASPHPAQRHEISSTQTLHAKGNHYASPQSRPTHQAATGPASSHPQLCPVWMARPPHTPRRAHALLAHDALPTPLSHLDNLAAMHAAVLIGWWHASIEFFHHWSPSEHPKNGHGGPMGQRLFAAKRTLLGRRRALMQRDPMFLHVRVQSQASDGTAPGCSWP